MEKYPATVADLYLHINVCLLVLQNTLDLITKQSEELESHAERLYESVLAAMDSLGTNLKNCDAQTAVKVDSSKWVSRGRVDWC